ncbi:ATP-binding cassette domain-containing protein [Nonomuraea phyllanthi]|uniref:ATP-binding cassette domain-containing protein n=1 Tax=Nonomuraea phyllanthi TaxID=2219224 RepID=A0A5C4W1V7_9ACTN|nr:ABC transporter ATP-binding protein [Nonomuraea phyllanthi]KAB8191518.1 ATP-binding cassette domain-containing protein [Nonomuraea phyllanthi]QFY13155.1 ATP-binding cassette domain-containing protein [Nonomuraea phyllanthi]
MSGDVAVDVRGVSKRFQDDKGREVHALQDVSFQVRRGEIVALTGRSGCGKTTLLRIIMGLEHPTSGAVDVDGEAVHGPGINRGIVFQNAELLPWRTALGNVEFGLEARRLPKAQRREAAEQAIELVGLKDAAHRRPHELSGGMRQRVGIARALAIDPAVLLMDEPFSALDAQTREKMQGELLEIHQRTGKTIIFVSHDIDESVLLADRVVTLVPDPGRVHGLLDTDFGASIDLDERRGSAKFAQRRHELLQLVHGREIAQQDGVSV